MLKQPLAPDSFHQQFPMQTPAAVAASGSIYHGTSDMSADVQSRFPTVRTVVTDESSLLPLTAMKQVPKFKPYNSDGSISKDYLAQRDDDALDVGPVFMGAACTPLKDFKKKELKNVHLITSHMDYPEDAILAGAIGRTAAANAELEESKPVPPPEFADWLCENEVVLAELPCIGFDGFPDFGENNDQQRLGQCRIAMLGSQKDSTVPTRILFYHQGHRRQISATEKMTAFTFAKCVDTGDWQVASQRRNSVAVINTSSQLVDISMDTATEVQITKSRTLYHC